MTLNEADIAMNERRCIVTGESADADGLIRFVAGPDGMVVPDLKRTLPGRGCWVTARRAMVDKAVSKKLFARALRRKVDVPDDLGALVDRLLVRQATGALSMARKAGALVSGAMQVDKAVRAGRATALLHALHAAPDGIRKLDQARRATVHLGGPDVLVFMLLDDEQMGLAFGGGNVIHAAVLDGRGGHAALRRLEALRDYRTGPDMRPASPDAGAGLLAGTAGGHVTAKETDQE